MSTLDRVVFEISLPPPDTYFYRHSHTHSHIHSQDSYEDDLDRDDRPRPRPFHISFVCQDRPCSWTCSVSTSTANITSTTADPFGLDNDDPPDLIISLKCRPIRTTQRAVQALVTHDLLYYSRLCISSMTPRGYYNAPPQQEPRPFVLIDMPVRQPETLLRGLRVDLHASTLPNVDEHTVLHVVLIKDKPPLLRGPYRPRTSEQHSSSSLSPRQIIGGPMRPSRLQRGAKYLGLDWSQKPLDARFISTEARQKLTAFLERAVGADIQLLFAKDPYDVVWLDYVCGRNDDDEEDEIHAHACVLGTVESDSMQRLLTTLPPEEEEKGNFKDDSVSDHEPAESENVTVASHHGTSTAGNNSRGTNINTANNNSMIPSSPPPPLIDQPQEPIRSIRFEDSPPAVVRAVVRYIYLGERPVVEANCGYTVKDLMALATFLEIEPLEEYCVALVLGLSPDCCCCESEEHELMLCSNYSSSSSSASSSSLGARWWRQRTTRAESENESLRSKWAPATKTTMMPRESMLQTLFAWGYRFPRIERALIRELVSDLGKILSNREAKILDRFKTHEAFERILVEMMKEQVLQRN